LRVVSGRFGGRRIDAPRGRRTRPTADRVREALFSMLGDVSGMTVLDLFAGSGALGIEALSRGAGAAVFVDRDPRAVACIRRNLASLGIVADVHRRDALAFLESERGDAFSLVFVDPPYSSAGELGRRLSERLPPVVTDDGLIVSESDRRHPLHLDLPLTRERTYGDTRIAFHRVR
jgi:16S rRNA (guanine966-N2)-methyltransferase